MNINRFRAASFALLAFLLLDACKIEDLLKKARHAIVKQDPAITAIFTGQQGFEYAAGKVADYVSIPIPRRFNGKNIVVPSALFLPKGTDRIPVMIIMHGDDGLHQHEMDYAKTLLNAGVGALVLDSFTPRTLTSISEDESAVSTLSLANDATTALSFLSVNKRVDMAHVGLLGFGKSGGAAINAALRSTLDATPLKDQVFRLHAAVYPDCSVQNFNMTASSAPVYLLLGEADNNTAACQLYAKKLKDAGTRVFVKIYPKATRGWDDVAAKPNPQAQNSANCIFEQGADKEWSEKTSGIQKIANLNGSLYRDALNKCSTRGLDQKYDEVLATAARDDIKALAQKELFQLQPLLVPKAGPPPAIPAKAKPVEKHKHKKHAH